MDTLFLHRGAELVSFDQLERTQTPAPTATHHPIPHATLALAVRKELAGIGLEVAAEQHAITPGGQRYFGLLKLTNGHQAPDYQLVAGLRNAHDRRFTAALTIGSSVFVCDNLAFSGEIVIGRKHTVYIERDLPGLVNRAVGRILDVRKRQDLRIAAYKEATLEDTLVHHLVIAALDSRVIPTTKIPAILAEWRKPSHEEFAPRTAWSLFNCFTEILKDVSPFELPARTIKLHGLLDRVAHVV